MDNTFINSVEYRIFVGESQTLIDSFVKNLEIDGSVFEALELDLIGSIIHYDPTTYDGYSPRYQQIWDNLKQQARVINFINSLVLGRGEYELTDMFESLLNGIKSKQRQGYVCAMEIECLVLVKSWDLYSLRGSGSCTDRMSSLREDAATQKTIKLALIEEVIRTTSEQHHEEVPSLVSDLKYLKCFAEFITKEGLDEPFRHRQAAYVRYCKLEMENKENMNKILLARSQGSGVSRISDEEHEEDSLVIVESSTPVQPDYYKDVMRRKLMKNDLSQFDATPFSTPGSVARNKPSKAKFVTKFVVRNAPPVTILPPK